MNGKIRRKIKNIILKTIACIMGLILVVATCMLDSESAIPFYACLISLAWLGLFAYANRDILKRL